MAINQYGSKYYIDSINKQNTVNQWTKSFIYNVDKFIHNNKQYISIQLKEIAQSQNRALKQIIYQCDNPSNLNQKFQWSYSKSLDGTVSKSGEILGFTQNFYSKNNNLYAFGINNFETSSQNQIKLVQIFPSFQQIKVLTLPDNISNNQFRNYEQGVTYFSSGGIDYFCLNDDKFVIYDFSNQDNIRKFDFEINNVLDYSVITASSKAFSVLNVYTNKSFDQQIQVLNLSDLNIGNVNKKPKIIHTVSVQQNAQFKEFYFDNIGYHFVVVDHSSFQIYQIDINAQTVSQKKNMNRGTNGNEMSNLVKPSIFSTSNIAVLFISNQVSLDMRQSDYQIEMYQMFAPNDLEKLYSKNFNNNEGFNLSTFVQLTQGSQDYFITMSETSYISYRVTLINCNTSGNEDAKRQYCRFYYGKPK